MWITSWNNAHPHFHPDLAGNQVHIYARGYSMWWNSTCIYGTPQKWGQAKYITGICKLYKYIHLNWSAQDKSTGSRPRIKLVSFVDKVSYYKYFLV